MHPRLLWILAALVTGGSVLSGAYAAKPEATPAAIGKGRAIYERSCMLCHGDGGKGDGPAAFFLSSYFSPRPSDFTIGQYKFRSTPSGSPATDQDLFRTITNGVPGYMPSFEGLTEEDRWHVVLYLKIFEQTAYPHPTVPLPLPLPTVPASPESIERGRQIYLQFECHACHGPNARGEPARSRVGGLKDSNGLPIRQTDLDLTTRYSFRNGHSAVDIYRTLMTGLNGTAMPSYANGFAGREEDAWHLVNYLHSLARKPIP